MSFNIALSGLAAASSDLRVTGNNIANAGTAGFKGSRAEFGDVYASTLSGSGLNQIGSGVRLANVSQQFDQGIISTTNNNLDLAIDGNGLFVVEHGGARSYTRAGMFGLDDEGFLVSSDGGRVQGFAANAAGNLSGNLDDLHLQTANVTPHATTLIETSVNLDAREAVLAERGTTLDTTGAAVGVAQGGAPGVANGYLAQAVDVVAPDGTVTTVNTAAGDSAAEIAAAFASSGVTATATSSATIPAAAFANGSGTLSLSVNGVAIAGTTLADFADAINNTAGLGTVDAGIDGGGDLVLTDTLGNDITIEVTGGAGGDTLDVQGPQGAAVTLTFGGTVAATVGGTVGFELADGYTMTNAVPASSNVFGSLGSGAFTPFERNTFDPANQNTYNAATSVTVYDSLGNAHTMTKYFVKEPFTPGVIGEEANRWSMYVQIDRHDVGEPDPGGVPTEARFDLAFNADGTLNAPSSDQILISNWTPLDADGEPNGALGPRTLAEGATLPVADPPVSSNFEIRLDGSTQFGSNFGVGVINQNGYTTGELVTFDIDADGLILARFTNGQSQVLGQVALADFANPQGLQATGNTSWAQTNASGDPVINAPGTGALGAISSGALEESNVDLSEELVNLIIAQRNFQANARTISTADEVTQTVIQL